MKTVLVVGFGEIGKSLYNVINETGKHRLFKKDMEDIVVEGQVDIMHICIPFFDGFVGTVSEYIKNFSPTLTVINSTVRPGTTDKIAKVTGALLVHSPVRGRHPNLEGGLRRFIKFIGPVNQEAGRLATEHFTSIGVQSEVCQSPATTELGKLLSTTYYAINISFHQEMNRMCDGFGVPFKQAVTRFNETCTMDIEHKIPRPIMFPGVIGGHCLLPNIEILQKDFPSVFLQEILDSNERRKQEIAAAEGHLPKNAPE